MFGSRPVGTSYTMKNQEAALALAGAMNLSRISVASSWYRGSSAIVTSEEAIKAFSYNLLEILEFEFGVATVNTKPDFKFQGNVPRSYVKKPF